MGLTHLQGLIVECPDAIEFGLVVNSGVPLKDLSIHPGAVRGQSVHQRDKLAVWHAIMPLQEV